MNDNFKLIIVIGSNVQLTEEKLNETSSSFLQEAVQYHIFTSYTPSNIILATKNSVAGKYINESLFSKDDVYQFFLSNDSICFEFDEVFSEIHPIDLIFNMNFPIEEMLNRLSTCILFSSQEEPLKTSLYDKFITKFLMDYFKQVATSLDSSERSIAVSCCLINQHKQLTLFNAQLASINEVAQMMTAINDKREQFLVDSSLKSESTITSLSILSKCSEITFIKLNTKEPLASNNTLLYLTKDVSPNVNLDKYEKTFLISSVSPSKANLKKSFQELYLMNDIYKEINSVKTNHSLNIPLLDSLRSLTSMEDMSHHLTGRRQMTNFNQAQSLQKNNQPSHKLHENNLSIIPPDCTMSLSETNYHVKNTRSDVEALYSYLKSLSVNLNEKSKYETQIKQLEEKLNQERIDKGEIEVGYKVALEKVNELNKNLSAKEKSTEDLKEKNRRIKSEKEDIHRKDEVRIMELMKENQVLRVSNDCYAESFNTLKESNKELNKRIASIQSKLSLLMQNKDTNTSKQITKEQ